MCKRGTMSNNNRGDTLVEVMLSISILGMVVVGCMAIMNRSSLNVLNSIDRTAVRADINRQTELANYAKDHEGSSSAWANIVNLAATNTDSINEMCKTNGNGKSFFLDISSDDVVVKTGNDVKGKNTTGRAEPGYGIWIDAVAVTPVESAAPSYIDLYVKSCWTRLGSDAEAKSNTILRLER